MSNSKILAATLAGALSTVAFLASANAAPGDGTQRTWSGNRNSDTTTSSTRSRGTASNQRGTTTTAPRVSPAPVIEPPVVVVTPPRPPVQVSNRDRDGDRYEPRHYEDHGERRYNSTRDWRDGDDVRYHRRHRRHWSRRWW